METQYESKLWEGELTPRVLESFKPDTIIVKGYGYIEHPWFNNARPVSEGGTLEEDGRSTKVKFVVLRGGIADWKIYHSMDANLTRADYLDDPEHLEASYESIRRGGAGLHNRESIKRLVPCTDETLAMYRD